MRLNGPCNRAATIRVWGLLPGCNRTIARGPLLFHRMVKVSYEDDWPDLLGNVGNRGRGAVLCWDRARRRVSRQNHNKLAWGRRCRAAPIFIAGRQPCAQVAQSSLRDADRRLRLSVSMWSRRSGLSRTKADARGSSAARKRMAPAYRGMESRGHWRHPSGVGWGVRMAALSKALQYYQRRNAARCDLRHRPKVIFARHGVCIPRAFEPKSPQGASRIRPSAATFRHM
jgi:hypothetical protein